MFTFFLIFAPILVCVYKKKSQIMRSSLALKSLKFVNFLGAKFQRKVWLREAAQTRAVYMGQRASEKSGSFVLHDESLDQSSNTGR